MFDLEIPAPAGAQSVERIGTLLGAAGIGLEGGGMWSRTAHFLVEDGEAAARVLMEAGLTGVIVRKAVLAELEADVPGALGRLLSRLVASGAVLHAQYTDHENRKVLVVEEPERAAAALGSAPGEMPTA